MKHEMRLTKEPFEQIASGVKQIESRLFDDKRKLINPGDEITFHLVDSTSHEIRTSVIAIYRYGSFKEMLNDFPPMMFGGNSKEDLLASIRKYYSEDEEQRYGVIGIKIQKQ